jgi:hypothetical protein
MSDSVLSGKEQCEPVFWHLVRYMMPDVITPTTGSQLSVDNVRPPRPQPFNTVMKCRCFSGPVLVLILALCAVASLQEDPNKVYTVTLLLTSGGKPTQGYSE